MSTALDIIKGSLRLIGVTDADEAPTSSQSSAALLAMQQMIDGWSADGLLIPYISTDSFALSVGTASYTYGTGGTFNSARPEKVLAAYIRASGGQDYPIKLIGESEYNRIPEKGASGMPTRLYYVPEYTLGKVYLDYAPDSAYTLYLDVLKSLTQPSALSTSISFPSGYDRAIRFNLAIELANEYGKSVKPETAAIALSSKRALRNANLRVPELSAVGSGRAYNIIAD